MIAAYHNNNIYSLLESLYMILRILQICEQLYIQVYNTSFENKNKKSIENFSLTCFYLKNIYIKTLKNLLRESKKFFFFIS